MVEPRVEANIFSSETIFDKKIKINCCLWTLFFIITRVPIQFRLFASLVISFVIALFVERRVFIDSFAINDDVRNQIYWMGRFVNSGYFANDYIADYFTQASMISPVIAAIYKSFSYIADPKILTQYLPFLIILVTTYFLYKACEIHADAKYAFWVSFVFNLYIWTMKYTAGALPRAFFYLLFFMFFYFLARRAWIILALVFALQALIYPTACFLSLATLVFEFIFRRVTWKVLLSYFSISTLILCFRYILFKEPGFGPLMTLEQAKTMPEFYIDGRAAVFVVPYGFVSEGIDWNLIGEMFVKFGSRALIIFAVLSVLAFICVRYRGAGTKFLNLPQYLYSSTYASLVLFVIAYLTLFYLYLPHRYIAYTLPLLPVFVIGSLLYQFEQMNSKRIWLSILLALGLGLGVSKFWREDLIHVSKPERKLHKFLQSTTVDSLVLAPMDLSSNIPAFAYRSVLVSDEVNIPFHQAYYQEISKRIEDQELIFNTENIQQLRALLEKYGVDLIVLDKRSNEISASATVSQARIDSIVYNNRRFTVIDAAKI